MLVFSREGFCLYTVWLKKTCSFLGGMILVSNFNFFGKGVHMVSSCFIKTMLCCELEYRWKIEILIPSSFMYDQIKIKLNCFSLVHSFRAFICLWGDFSHVLWIPAVVSGNCAELYVRWSKHGFPASYSSNQSIDKNGGKSNSKLSPCFSLEIG